MASVKDDRTFCIETLAKMAARLAGRDPDELVSIRLGRARIFEGPAWQYPDFIARANAAYQAIEAATPQRPQQGDARSRAIANDVP